VVLVRYRPFGKAARLTKLMRAEHAAEAAGDPPPDPRDFDLSDDDDSDGGGDDGDDDDDDDDDGSGSGDEGGRNEGSAGEGAASPAAGATAKGAAAKRKKRKGALDEAEEAAVFRLALASLWTAASAPHDGSASSSRGPQRLHGHATVAGADEPARSSTAGELGQALAGCRRRLRVVGAERDESVRAVARSEEAMQVTLPCDAGLRPWEGRCAMAGGSLSPFRETRLPLVRPLLARSRCLPPPCV
jgi:hypothetical protein